MSGIITTFVINALEEQVDEYGVVVWYDPGGYYRDVPPQIDLADTTMARYQGSYYALRHRVDDLLEGEQPPRLIVYVPLARGETHDALIELEAAGVVLRPGQQPPSRNMDPGLIARHAMRTVMPEEALLDIERQVEAGKLSLADLDALAEKGGDMRSGLIVSIFGTSNPRDVALKLLGSEDYDAALRRRDALPELARLLEVAYEVHLGSLDEPEAFRTQLVRHLLITELIARLGDRAPVQLGSVSQATTPGAVSRCVDLAAAWRNRTDVRGCRVLRTWPDQPRPDPGRACRRTHLSSA